MPQGNAIAIAFIGFGEVGQTFSRGLLTHDGVRITVHDLLFAGPDDALRERARELRVAIADSAQEALAGADIVISAVTAAQAEAVALDLGPHLRPGQIVLDVNSAAPSTKRRAAAAVEAAGAHYVEGAVMAPVLKPGLAVPILAGGPMAAEVAARLNPLGMNLTPVSVEHGRASAMKLCRSIVIKGLEALMLDCTAASRQWGVTDEVFASLAGTFPAIDWHALSADMGERVAAHGVRRAAEMREAGEMLGALGRDPGLAQAVAEAQLRGVRVREHAGGHSP